jgi:hypothetical protein
MVLAPNGCIRPPWDAFVKYILPIHFPDTDDRATCLCTFPFNNGQRIDLQEMRSLAMLGAAVVMQHHKHEEYRYLPGDLPQWIVDEIDRVILGRSAE